MNANIIEEVQKGKGSNTTLSSLLWVSKAVSNDPLRNSITGVHIEDDPSNPEQSLAVGTDGRRLNLARLPKKIVAGEYKIWKTSSRLFLAVSKDMGMYPKYQSVVPSCDANDMRKIDLTYLNRNDGVRIFKICCQFYAVKNSYFNAVYLQQATQDLPECFVHQVDEMSPVRIQDSKENWTRIAIVMPVRIN